MVAHRNDGKRKFMINKKKLIMELKVNKDRDDCYKEGGSKKSSKVEIDKSIDIPSVSANKSLKSNKADSVSRLSEYPKIEVDKSDNKVSF